MFLIIFMSPLNHGGGGRKIPIRSTWRYVMYVFGIVMGICYASSAFIGTFSRPFETCAETPEKDYLMFYIYTTLLPVGAIMGAFHVVFLIQRQGPKPGEGACIADGPTVLCCVLGQAYWIAIWASWIVAVLNSCGGFHVAPLTLGLSCAGSTIIFGITLLRLTMFIQAGGNCAAFAQAYTGANFEGSGFLYSAMPNST
mmetsp:Transcript_23346/g.42796  ORF Transcript_23346/g.42796 Transcript_23346/m.42796 type:complete len:198 (+) Transcript_23346:2-595(+)